MYDVDVSMGDVSSGDAVLPVYPTVPEIIGEAIGWYSPTSDEEAAEVSVPVSASADELALLQDLGNKVSVMISLLAVLCFFVGFIAGISFIKCFFIWRG